MRILVTGAAGFIGQHLCAELSDVGHDVCPVDRVDGDLRRKPVAAHLIRCHKPAVVVHLAAKVGRLFGEDDVVETVVDNAGMTALVAKACGEAGVRLVYASTSEVYGDNAGWECFEDPVAWQSAGHPPNATWLHSGSMPHNAYGLSKRWGEEACQLYAPDGLTVWRISMPYGPGLPAGRGRAAIINMLDQAQKRQPIPVHRGAERSWCWIGDTVRAMRMTIEDADGGVFNIGRDDDPQTMLHVAEIACQLTGASPHLIHEVDPPVRQTIVKRLSTEKIRKLGWTPTVSLEEGMARTLETIREAAAA